MNGNPTDKLTGLEIAVIGMAGRFPGAGDIHRFWDNLTNGEESIAFFSHRELEEAGVPSQSIVDPNYIKSMSKLEDTACFDAAFFNYSPTEAEIMAPHIRIFFENTWAALEDAGYDPLDYKGKIGCYVGASSSFQWQALSIISGKNQHLGGWASALLSGKDNLGTQLAYKLDLKGPSFTFFTACSTSLVAVHLGSRALLTGECYMALAGGVSLDTSGKPGYLYQPGMINSPDGHCRAFDAKAGGTVFGEGVGTVVLKRYRDAVKDGDHIYAVIKGSTVNNDGTSKVGYTAPGLPGQKAVVSLAHKTAKVNPETITYVETHGTATQLGDTVEIEALKQAFNTEKKQFCAVGSVKTNIGHLDAAAGIAGFIKTVLALKHRLIPPSLHFEIPNPQIDFDNSPFYVNTRLLEWKQGEKPLRAGVSSFGIGGTNAHVILEECPDGFSPGTGRPGSPNQTDHHLLLLSAKSPSALERMTVNLANYLKANYLNENLENKKKPGFNLADAAFTLQVGRRVFRHRQMVIGSGPDKIYNALTHPDTGKVKRFSAAVESREPAVIFMFPGLGSQYVDMGRGLYKNEPFFREEADRCFEICNSLLDYHLKPILYPGPHPPAAELPGELTVDHPEISQLALFTVEYALAKLLIHWGITPRAMIGYSFGEYTAACISGVFSLEDALKLIIARGNALQKIPDGAMLSIPLPMEEVVPLLTSNHEPGLSPAIDNGPSCVVAGPTAAVEAFQKKMKEKKILCMTVPVSRALHSQMTAPISSELETFARSITLNSPQIPYISNVSGTWITDRQAADPSYWSTHMRQTVRFADGIRSLAAEDPNALYLEVGAGRDLSALVARTIDDNPQQRVINLIRHRQKDIPDRDFLLEKIGRLWLYGKKIPWDHIYSTVKRKRTPLPTYPFEKQRYWIDEAAFESVSLPSLTNDPYRKKPNIADWFYIPSWERSMIPNSPEPAGPSCWLVLADNCGLGDRTAKYLEEKHADVVVVKAGREFSRVNPREYTVNPGKRSDYQTLMDQLKASGKITGPILHLWNVTGGKNDKPGVRAFDSAQDHGLFSLFFLAKAIAKSGTGKDLKLFVISDNVQDITGREHLGPPKSTSLTAVKTIPQEYPNILCRSIDIELPEPGSPREKKLVHRLVGEFSMDSTGPVVAYRGDHRWVQTFVPVHLESIPGDTRVSRIKQGGVYLVTGGLGHIGLELAEYLFETFRAKLVLTRRSPFPRQEEWENWMAEEKAEEKAEGAENRTGVIIRKLKALEKKGAEILVSSADAADRGRMEQVVTRCEERFGPIDGVIHAAGVLEGGAPVTFIEKIEKSACRGHFRAKVYALQVLEEIFRERKLDFCLLTSSISTVLGGLGFAPYAAANQFMDSFVNKHNRESTVPWICINWGDWRRGAPPAENAASSARRLEMTPGEGVETFCRTLHHVDAGQVIVSSSDLQIKIDRWVKLESVRRETGLLENEDRALHKRPELSESYIPPRGHVQQTLAGIWGHMFGFDRIGARDDFFELGGDSLKVITAAAKIHKALNTEISLTEFFNHSTIESLALYIETAGKQGYSTIGAVEKKEFYPVSPAQKRLYILHQLENEFTGYNETSAVLIEGTPAKEKIERAFKKLIRRHESLRTSFKMIDNRPVQRVHDDVAFQIEYYDLAAKTREEARRKTLSPAAPINDFVRPFDLSSAPLLRVGLIGLEPGKHLLIYDMPHIVTDGTSNLLLAQDFPVLYNGGELPPLNIQYKDFSQWQNNLAAHGGLKKQEEYWLDQFAGEVPVPDLPIDFPRPAVQDFGGGFIAFAMDIRRTRALKDLARQKGATLYMVLAAVYNILLAKISGREDIVMGVPTAGRRHADLERVIGMFVNTLAMRNYPEEEKSVSTFLSEVKKQALGAFENQEYPFEDLVEKVTPAVGRDMGRGPLFDVLFVFQNIAVKPGDAPPPGAPAKNGLTVLPYEFEHNISKFDLVLHGAETGDTLSFKLGYRTRLFKEETIRRFTGYFKKITASVLQNPERQISGIEIITPEEKQRLLVEFNDTNALYPKDKTIHRLFEEQVEKTPDNIAVIGDRSNISYRELSRKSQQLAHLLLSKGVGPGDIAAMTVNRSMEMITSIFGILKTGAAYLPIDPGYPEERIGYILRDSKAGVLLTDRESAGEISAANHVISLRGTHPALRAPLPGGDLPGESVRGEGLAYIIYTSGTTGRPKGVAIRHRNVVRLMTNDKFLFDFCENDVWTLFHSYCFDFSVWEMYGALLYGGKLVVIPKMAAMDTRRYLEILKEYRVTVLNQTPSAFYQLMELELNHPREDLTLRYVIFGGEALNPSRLKQWKTKYPAARLINMYGITETTVHVTFKEITRKDIAAGIGNIGCPIPTLTAYIMNKQLRLLPTGAAGELCAGGDGVGMGYLNNPELTHEKFVENPYKPGEILYRSGDLARLSAAGELEYRGRIDHQVKIRGFRIELGEIEARLSTHGDIREIVAVAGEDGKGDKYICAYFVPAPEAPTPPVTALKDYLSRRLPAYMVPSYFVPLDTIPLTPNGKVDRRALPRPEVKTGEQYVPPANNVEDTLTRIWSGVLGIPQDKISTGADFFELGGHSLRATVVVSMIHKEFDIKISLAEVFMTPTIKGLAAYINGAEKEKYAAIPPSEKMEYYPLSPAQNRLYMLQRLGPGSILYNMPVVVVLEGDTHREKLEDTFARLIQRHESYRTAFKTVNGDVVQVIHPHVDFKIEYKKKRGTVDEDGKREAIDGFVRPFDLSKAPLFRAGLIKSGEKEHILMVDTHHIISDGTSQGLFIRDLSELFAGEAPSPPPLTIQYRDYSLWRNSERFGGELKHQEAYWLKVFEGDIHITDLPLDFERPAVQGFEGRVSPFVIGAGETARLKEIALREGASLFVLMLSILDVLVAKLTRRDDVVVGTEIAGRSHAELQNIIGLFLNTLALRNFPNPEKSFRSFLKETTRRTLGAFENQDYLFEDLVEKTIGKRPVNRNPLFDVMFVWQNMEMKEVRLPGLTLRPYPVDPGKSRALIDLSLYGWEAGDTLDFHFEYNTALFKKETIQRFITYFKEIVTAVTANIDVKLKNIKISHDLAMAKVDVFKESDDEFEF